MLEKRPQHFVIIEGSAFMCQIPEQVECAVPSRIVYTNFRCKMYFCSSSLIASGKSLTYCSFRASIGEMKLRPGDSFFKCETDETNSYCSNTEFFCGTYLVLEAFFATTLSFIEVVWSRMSGIAQSLSPRAAFHVHSLRKSTPCQRQCTIQKASRRMLYDNTLGHTATFPRTRRKPWVTTFGLRVGTCFLCSPVQ